MEARFSLASFNNQSSKAILSILGPYHLLPSFTYDVTTFFIILDSPLSLIVIIFYPPLFVCQNIFDKVLDLFNFVNNVYYRLIIMEPDEQALRMM